jgi:predicted ABC-type ATPase
MAIERVRGRVAQGGHDVPEAVIRRRFVQGWDNFSTCYHDAVDAWQVFDAKDDHPVLCDQGVNPWIR